MLVIAKYASIVLLFLLIYAACRQLLNAVRRPSRYGAWRTKLGQAQPSVAERHLTDLLQSAATRISARGFLLLSAVSCTSGIAVGAFYFASVKAVIITGGCLGVLPYVWLRSRLISMQYKHRIDFLPAVECFYHVYVLSESKNIRTVLKEAIQGDRMTLRLRTVFEQLYAGLMMHRSPEECLRSFQFALGSKWADHFAAMLGYALDNGADLSDGLRELVSDMRRAIRSDQAERNRLLEIRIANFSPLLFLLVFLVVNIRIDPEQAYRYYVLSEAGKEMLLDALLLIAVSFGMGMYLSMKKM